MGISCFPQQQIPTVKWVWNTIHDKNRPQTGSVSSELPWWLLLYRVRVTAADWITCMELGGTCLSPLFDETF